MYLGKIVTFASIGDVALGAVARIASILLSAVAVLTLAKEADHVSWALA
jgi:hypothetical protein